MGTKNLTDIEYAIKAKDQSQAAVDSATRGMRKLKKEQGEFGKKTGQSTRALKSFGEGTQQAAYSSRELLASIAGPQFSMVSDIIQKSAEQMNQLREATDKEVASAGALKVAIGAALVYGAVRLSAYALGWDEANAKIKEQIELAKELTKQIIDLSNRRQSMEQFKISLIDDPKKQRAQLKYMIGELEKEISSKKHNLQPALDELNRRHEFEDESSPLLRPVAQFAHYLEFGEDLKQKVESQKQALQNAIRQRNQLIEQQQKLDLQMAKTDAEDAKTKALEKQAEIIRKAADETARLNEIEAARLGAIAQQADKNTAYINGLRLQYVALNEGAEAAAILRAQLSGVDQDVIDSMQVLRDGIKRLKEEQNQTVTPEERKRIFTPAANTAVESRLLTRGSGIDFAKMTADNTKRIADRVEQQDKRLDDIKRALERKAPNQIEFRGN